jgi:hypothetical protein
MVTSYGVDNWRIRVLLLADADIFISLHCYVQMRYGIHSVFYPVGTGGRGSFPRAKVARTHFFLMLRLKMHRVISSVPHTFHSMVLI